MELTRREFAAEGENPVLRSFLDDNAELLDALAADGKTAQVAPDDRRAHWRRGGNRLTAETCVSQDVYDATVQYFGEKSAPPSRFFNTFIRFIKAYKVRGRGPGGGAQGPGGGALAMHPGGRPRGGGASLQTQLFVIGSKRSRRTSRRSRTSRPRPPPPGEKWGAAR